MYVRPDNVHDLGHNLLSAQHLFGTSIYGVQVGCIASISLAAHAPTLQSNKLFAHNGIRRVRIGATTSEDVHLGNFGARS